MAANYYIPGHGTILSCILITAIILAYVSYVLLTLPTYYYLCLFLSFYIYKVAKSSIFSGAKSKPSFAPNNSKTNVCIVGAGFSGLCMGIKLKKAGIPFRILEKSSQIGGTWHANQYPGCRCDVWSILYQFTFFLNPYWSTYVTPANEIRQYLEKVVSHFGLKDHISLHTGVTKAVWMEESQSWRVETTKNETFSVTHLVSGCGALRKPNIPDIKGLNEFKGKMFHSAEWDLNYDYSDKKVAIIGSAATAVQVSTAMVDHVRELYVFQRSPNWYIPRVEGSIPKWAQHILATLPILNTMIFWITFVFAEVTASSIIKKGFMSKIWAKLIANDVLNKINGDKDLAAKLIPNYEIGCKRVLMMNDFAPMFVNKSNAHLITEGIEEITDTGIITKSGNKIQVDLIVLATGFQIEDSIVGFEVLGKNQIDLRQHFDSNPVAYNGITVPNFPNFFLLLGPNTVLAHNSVIFMIECQVDYIMSCLKQMNQNGISSIEVKVHKAQKFRQQMDEWTKTRNFLGNCRGWYKNKDGINFILWPSNLFHYWWITYKADLLQDYRLGFTQTEK